MPSEQITSRFWVAWLHFMLNYILRLVELLSSLSTCVWEDADKRPPLCKSGVTGSTFRMSYFCWLFWPLSTLKQVQYDLTFQLLSFFSLSLCKSLLEGVDFIKRETSYSFQISFQKITLGHLFSNTLLYLSRRSSPKPICVWEELS